jgi:hypothetical protein
MSKAFIPITMHTSSHLEHPDYLWMLEVFLNALRICDVCLDMIRFYLSAGLIALAATVASGNSTARTVNLPAPARWLTDDANRVYALLENGSVMRSDGTNSTTIATAWSANAPIRFAHGRLHGISQQGELLVLEGGRLRSSNGAKLSLKAGLLPLPAGVIAVADNGDLR